MTKKAYGNSGIKFYDMIKNYQGKFFPNIPVSLVLGHIQQESSFDPEAYRYEAVIKDASYGLMQLLYGTAKWLGYSGLEDGLYDPQTNIYYGMKYINYLMGQFPGNPEGYIMAYNVGPAGYRKGRRNEYYYSKVIEYSNKWKGILNERGLTD